MRKYIVEFIGAFFLVFTVGMTGLPEPFTGVIPPLAIGAVLMVMIYAGGHISGGHFNPAVTLAVWIRGRCPTADVPWYMLAQFLAAIVAGAAAIYARGYPRVPLPPGLDVPRSLLVEFLFAFALCYVVLNTATSKDHPNNSFYGLAIGFTVLVGAFAVGPISGGAFNPAVALGITYMGLKSFSALWVFLLANFAGGAVAGGAFKFLNPEDP
jgi:aquaporin Z